MKKLLLLPALALLLLAAACGSGSGAASTHTVTVTKTKTVYRTPPECRTMGKHLAHSSTIMVQVASGLANLIPAAYKAGFTGSSVAPINSKLNAISSRIAVSTKAINAATALVDQCFG